jgi:hypothetical protein
MCTCCSCPNATFVGWVVAACFLPPFLLEALLFAPAFSANYPTTARCSLSMAFQENVHTILFLGTSVQRRCAVGRLSLGMLLLFQPCCLRRPSSAYLGLALLVPSDVLSHRALLLAHALERESRTAALVRSS